MADAAIIEPESGGVIAAILNLNLALKKYIRLPRFQEFCESLLQKRERRAERCS